MSDQSEVYDRVFVQELLQQDSQNLKLEYEALKQAVENKKQDINEKLKYGEYMKDKLKKSKEKLEILKIVHQHVEVAVPKLESKRSQIEKMFTETTAEYEQITQKYHQLDESIKVGLQECEKPKKESELFKMKFEKEVNDAKQKNDDLKADLEKSKQSVIMLQKEINAKKEVLKELDNVANKKPNLLKQLNDSEQTLNKLNIDLQKAKEGYANYLKQQEEGNTVLEKLKHNVEAFENEIRQLKTDVNNEKNIKQDLYYENIQAISEIQNNFDEKYNRTLANLEQIKRSSLLELADIVNDKKSYADKLAKLKDENAEYIAYKDLEHEINLDIAEIDEQIAKEKEVINDEYMIGKINDKRKNIEEFDKKIALLKEKIEKSEQAKKDLYANHNLDEEKVKAKMQLSFSSSTLNTGKLNKSTGSSQNGSPTNNLLRKTLQRKSKNKKN